MAKLSTILDQIDAGSMLLPEFQRGYVWNRDQVRGLMRSLYHGYPVGALLVWETEGNGQAVRGGTDDGRSEAAPPRRPAAGDHPVRRRPRTRARRSSRATPTRSRACGSTSRPRRSSSTRRSR